MDLQEFKDVCAERAASDGAYAIAYAILLTSSPKRRQTSASSGVSRTATFPKGAVEAMTDLVSHLRKESVGQIEKSDMRSLFHSGTNDRYVGLINDAMFSKILFSIEPGVSIRRPRNGTDRQGRVYVIPQKSHTDLL